MTIHPLSKTVKITRVTIGQFTKAEIDKAREQNRKNVSAEKMDVFTRTEQKFCLS